MINKKSDFAKGWASGLPETVCGGGSTMVQTEIQRAVLPRWVAEFDINTIVDVGAGDLNWVQAVEWPHEVFYAPLDLVPRHESVSQFDITEAVPPAADLLLFLWVGNHMPVEDCEAAMRNLQESGSRYLALTYAPWMWDCMDLPACEEVMIKPRKESVLRLVALNA